MKSARMRMAGLLVFALPLVSGCTERPDVYSAVLDGAATFALDHAVAVVDGPANRVLLLSPSEDGTLTRTFVKVGPNVSYVATSSDGKRLFVLSAGDLPREVGKSERPSLTIVERTAGSGVSFVSRRLEMEGAHASISVDPRGRYLALFDGTGGRETASGHAMQNSAKFVSNPNEIVLVDLFETDAERAIVPRTIRSFGGRPQRIHFTDPLTLPAGARRLLVAEGTSEITLLDLSHVHDTPVRPEVTVRLPQSASGRTLAPEQVVWHDGAKDRADDARIAVRLLGDPNVLSLTLGAAAAGATNEFTPLPNLADVGGVPTDIAFVETDVGTRLAALVPTSKAGVLVEPDTSVTQSVALGTAYTNLALVGGPAGTSADTALLYGKSAAAGVAFWTLGRVGTEAYRSVDPMDFGGGTEELVDIPDVRGSGSTRKILKGPNDFVVLDLGTRGAAPLSTPGSYNIHVSPQGSRIWAFEAGGTRLAQVNLATLHPVDAALYDRIDRVYEVPSASGKNFLLALDLTNGVSVTVLEGDKPDIERSTSYHGLFLEGLEGAVR